MVIVAKRDMKDLSSLTLEELRRALGIPPEDPDKNPLSTQRTAARIVAAGRFLGKDLVRLLITSRGVRKVEREVNSTIELIQQGFAGLARYHDLWRDPAERH